MMKQAIALTLSTLAIGSAQAQIDPSVSGYEYLSGRTHSVVEIPSKHGVKITNNTGSKQTYFVQFMTCADNQGCKVHSMDIPVENNDTYQNSWDWSSSFSWNFAGNYGFNTNTIVMLHATGERKEAQFRGSIHVM